MVVVVLVVDKYVKKQIAGVEEKVDLNLQVVFVSCYINLRISFVWIKPTLFSR